MLVRQLIGRDANQIIDMPFTAGQNCIAAGTAAALSQAEVEAASGVARIEGVMMAVQDAAPTGYTIELDPVEGYNVKDPGGVLLTRKPVPSAAAARDFARRDHEKKVAPVGIHRLTVEAMMATAEHEQQAMAYGRAPVHNAAEPDSDDDLPSEPRPAAPPVGVVRAPRVARAGPDDTPAKPAPPPHPGHGRHRDE